MNKFFYSVSIKHVTNLINTIYYGKDGKTSGKETYTYDGMGNIVSVSRDGKQKKAYTYDALNRIISEKDIDKEQEICYTYDNNGNILTKSVNGVVTSYAYEEGTDRLTSYGDKTIEYDGMGNITKAYENGEMKIRYEYNALNRLVREDNKELKRTEVYWKMVKKNVTKYRSENQITCVV